MPGDTSELTESELASVRQHVDRVLASQSLIQAERLRRFLSYVVDHALSGDAGGLNQYAIAIDVFDRDETFDPAIDAIVRVEAGRLRSKLLEYYDDEGASDSVRISLPKRGYAVQFQFREGETLSGSPAFQSSVPRAHQTPGLSDSSPTIAVLPFDNMSSDSEQEYFSDGITEDLITDLSRQAGLSVIARQSSFTYKGKATNAQAASAELGADYIVEGSIRKVGRRVRINAQLIEGKTGTHIWAQRFDCDLDDIFDIQDSVNRKIVDALKLQISTVRQSQSQSHDTTVIEAYDYLLRGMKEEQDLTREGYARARYCFGTALELDPEYSNAYSRLGLNAVYEWITGWNNSRKETVDWGMKLAEKAVTVNGDNAFAYSALSWTSLWKGQHDAAISAGKKAIELDANSVAALERLAFALAWSGEAEEALPYLAKAQVLNPLHAYNFPCGVSHFMLERYSVAAEYLRDSVLSYPNFLPAHLYLAASLSMLEELDEAGPVVETIKSLSPNYRPTEIMSSVFRQQTDWNRFINAIVRVLDP